MSVVVKIIGDAFIITHGKIERCVNISRGEVNDSDGTIRRLEAMSSSSHILSGAAIIAHKIRPRINYE